MITTKPSLRERNRQQTQSEIHSVAIRRALHDGLAETTIDALALEVGISVRTFFNYFSTKEDAVLGVQLPQLTDETISDFQRKGIDPLEQCVTLIDAVVNSMFIPSSNRTQRKKILAQHPELGLRMIEHVSEIESLVSNVVKSHFREFSTDARTALLMLSGAIVRFSFEKEPLGRHRELFNSKSAVTLFRSAIQEIL